ncbi:hypothetical protein CQ018_04375 [Arthrobacter sp. MYb227]|uniref:DUF4062 domain-containing protein n=1 Tax=Arthrobacter sp. MYb227 TaxID=1848601 RepID=UPI000CFD4515|nr:DUF4062 domain-containing protein [Arthrobacter sp. MYb227]PQZ94597.1 hypothetical protein CQ018_04375 [Arthrobacter sp. MYb227]
MAFTATVVQVFIASPSDTSSSRDAVERALSRWNASRAENDHLVILPRRYETSAVPAMGSDGQQIINKQLVDSADIVVAIFANKLGSATPREISGTVEEIKEAQAAGKKVHVYFSEAPVPQEFMDQVAELEKYKKEFKGLYGTYVDDSDLVDQVRHAIDTDMPSFGGKILQANSSSANPIARHHDETYTKYDSKGLPKNAHKHSIVIENKSDAVAEDFLVKFSGEDEAELNLWFMHEPLQETLHAHDNRSYRFEMSMQSADRLIATMTWAENGEPKERIAKIQL